MTAGASSRPTAGHPRGLGVVLATTFLLFAVSARADLVAGEELGVGPVVAGRSLAEDQAPAVASAPLSGTRLLLWLDS